MQSRKEKIQKNVVSSVLLNFFNMLMAFVGRIIFLRVLDANYLGINSLFSNILGLLSMADLGMSTAMMYSLYKPLAQQDNNKIASLVWFFRKIYLAIAGAVFVIGISLVPFLQYIVNLEVEIPHIEAYYLISLLGVCISYLFVYRSILITADQKQYEVNKISFYFRIVLFVIQVSVLLLFQDYLFYVLVALPVGLINNFILSHKAMKLYPFLKSHETPLTRSEKATIKGDIKSLFIYKISGTIVNNTDNIFTSVLVSTLIVGYYSNYLLIVNNIKNVLWLVFTQLRITVCNVLASDGKNIEEKLQLFKILQLLNYWIVAFSSIAFYVLLNDFIALAFGTDMVLSTAIVLVVVVNFYRMVFWQTLAAFREASGLFKQTQNLPVVSCVLNVIYSLILGYYFGLFGIVFATTLASFSYEFWKEPQILFHQYFGVSSKWYFKDYFVKALLTIVVGAMTVLAADMCNTITNDYIAFIGKMAVCTIVPNVIFLIVFWRSKEFQYLQKNIIKMVLKKAS